MITIGSCFSGIGAFELGLERAIKGSQTIWQIEKNDFCRQVLRKHWPKTQIYQDITQLNSSELEKPTIICGGFPCQDISKLGKMEGIHGKRSGLWWKMHGIISNLRPRVVVLENVDSIISRGVDQVLGSLAEIGYNSKWKIVSARQFGAPHLRRRWFAIAYPDSLELRKQQIKKQKRKKKIQSTATSETRQIGSYWKKRPPESVICSMDDGTPNRLAMLRALGNSIVPQCSEFIGSEIINLGLLDDQ